MRLFASIHDVSPRFEAPVDALFDRLGGLIGSPRLAMLVVPDFEGAATPRPFRSKLKRSGPTRKS